MPYYIEAIRNAAEKCDRRKLKDALDFILGLAQEDYNAGALDVLEYAGIADEYADTLKAANVINCI